MTSRPTFLDGLLRWRGGREAEIILGDLDEEWPERLREGRLRAMGWYVRATLGSLGGSRTRARGRGGMVSVSGRGWGEDLWHELRRLGRTPLWTAAAVGTVAIGLVFSGVVYAVADATLTQLVPYPDADRLFYLAETNGQVGAVAHPTLERLRLRDDAFESVAAWVPGQDINLTRPEGEPTVARAASVLPGTLEVFGGSLVAGRSLQPSDEDFGGQPAALISAGFWQREFAGDPDAIGSVLVVNGRGFTLVGVTASNVALPGSTGPLDGVDIWLPILQAPNLQTDPGLRYQVVVRAAPGVDQATVAALADQLLSDMRNTLPQWRTDESWRIAVQSLRSRLEGEGRRALSALAAAAALLMVLAGANLGALTLARRQSRDREFMLYEVLGAPPSVGRRRLLAQNLLVALVGAIVASGMGHWVLQAVRAADLAWLPAASLATFGTRERLVVAVLAIALSMGVAWVAALAGQRADHRVAGLRSRGPGGGWKRLAHAIVGLETAMVVSLGVGAGLVVRSFVNLTNVESGMSLDRRIAARVVLAHPRYETSQAVREFTSRVLDELVHQPGVVRAAATTSAPLAPSAWNFVFVEGRDPDQGPRPTADLEEVTPGFFDVMGLAVLEGRGLEAQDYRAAGPPVVVINEQLAALFEGSPIGRTLHFSEGPDLQVLGVVQNVPAGRLDTPPSPRVYLADMDQAFPWPVRTRWFLVETAEGAPVSVGAEALRAAVSAVHDEIPVQAPRTLRALRGDLLGDARFRGLMFGFLGIVALVLGAVGIYGVVSHSLAASRKEAGIRLALGSSRRRVFAQTVFGEAVAVGVGALVGVGLAWQLGSMLASILFGVSSTDLRVYLVVLGAVGVLALTAIVIPALRSAASDPMATLRAEG